MIMQLIVVFLTQDSSKSERIWVSGDLSKKEISKELDRIFKDWFYYDIVCSN